MGITIVDTITLTNGLSASNTYASFYDQLITINQTGNNDDTYNLRGEAKIWINQTYRTNGSPHIEKVIVYCSNVAAVDMTNPYTLLYTQFKSHYTSTFDV